MKNLKIWSLLLIALIFVVGCDGDKEDSKKSKAIVKEWRIESWNNESPVFDVYIAFNEDGTFEMYQQVYTLTYAYYGGTYIANDGLLSGVYSDGSPWESIYKYSVSEDGSQLTLESEESISVVSVYVNETIPEEVKAEAESDALTRSEVRRAL